MSDVVHHDPEPFQRSDSEQGHVPGLRKHNLVVGLVALGAEDGVADVALNLLLRRPSEDPYQSSNGSYDDHVQSVQHASRRRS